ncbi:MAG: T9SS type A sorting domain-containing protein [Bacteroidales bacterium]|nr:T9SS type A sorting domain-containing protein [Bacteroidales bacterium]
MGESQIGMNGASVTFNNVTFNWAAHGWPYHGLQHCGDMNYNNCTINGTVFLYGTSEIFNNCTFNVTGNTYNVWTYGAKEVAFNGCTFNSAGKSVLIYSEQLDLVNNVTVTDCDFIASSLVEGKAAIEMDSSLTAGINLTIDSEDTPEEDRTTANGFGSGNVSGNSLWNNKKGNNDDANNDITVVVAGEIVLEPVYVAKIGEEGHRTLQEAINEVENGETITLLANCDEAVHINKTNVAFTIDGQISETEKVDFSGVIGINIGQNVTIRNIDFNGATANHDFIKNEGSPTGKNYNTTLLVENCSFTGNSEFDVVGVRTTHPTHTQIVNCTADGLHSLLQNTGGQKVTADKVVVINGKEGGLALGGVRAADVKNSDITANGYGIRIDAATKDAEFNIESSEFNAYIPVIARKATAQNVNFTFSGENTMTQTNDDDVWFVIENGNNGYHNGNVSLETLDTPTGNVSVTLNDTGLDREGIYGSALNGEGTEKNPYLIETVNDLVFFRDRVNGGNNYAGKYVKLDADIDLSSIENWTPIGDITYNNKYQPADNDKVFSGVFNGNDKVISNLKIEKIIDEDPDTDANVGLFGITGEGAVIKNLTLTNVDIKTSGRNVGALAGFAYMATLENITVNGDIKIEGGNNVSGVAGMTRYYAMSATNIKVIGNDGSTIVGNNIVGGIFAEIAPNGSEQTFKNLSVENVAINGVGGVGGIVGLLTLGTVEDVTVKNVALTGNTLYQGNTMGRIRLGSVSGLMGSTHATIANVTTENVTAKNLEGTEIEDLPIIGANYGAATNATEARIGDTYYSTLKKAIEAAVSVDNTIQLLADITGDVTVTQKEGVNIVIDGKKAENKNYQFNGTIYIEGNSRNTGEETLTIQNVNFYTGNPSHDFISANSTDSDKRYAHNVTVIGCNFATSETNVNNKVVGLRLRQAYDIAVENCTSNNIFSLMWSTGVVGLDLNKVTVNNCTEGISIGGKSQNVTITDSNITSPSFGIRASVEGGQFTMTSSTINALVPVVVRNENDITDLAQYTLSFTFNGTNNIAESNPTNYWFVAGETEYKGQENEELPTAPAGTVIVTLNDTNLSYDGVYGNFAVAKIGSVQYTSFADAATASKDGETIQLIWAEGNDPIAMAATFVGNKTVTITGTADVDWDKGWLYVGRNGEGNGKLIFREANLTSKSVGVNGNGIGLNVSCKKEGQSTTNDGEVEIIDSHIQLDYLIGKGNIKLDNSTLNVYEGFAVGAHPASETGGVQRTVTMDITNGSNVIVKNHNGQGLGYESMGIMNIDATSTFETTQSFLVTADGTMNVNGGNVKVAGTLTNAGTVYVTGAANLDATVTGDGWFYMNGVTLDADTKLLGAKVRFASGTNNIDGSTIDDGFFQVGIGAYNGTDANVDTEDGVVVNVKNAVVGANGDPYAGWAGTGFYDTDAEKVAAMTDAKYVLNIENSIAEFGYLHVSNDGELNVNGNATEKAWYNNSDYSFYAGEVIINGTATFDATDVLALYTKVSCDNGTDNPGTLNINEGTEYEAERHNDAVAGLNFDIRKTGIVNVAEGADLHVGEPASIAADATMNIGGTATVLGELTNNGTINFTSETATLTVPTTGLEVNNETGNNDIKVVYENGTYKFIDKHYVAEIVGGAKYETLAEAIEAVAENGTVKLIDHEIFTEDNRTCSSGTWYEGVYYVGDKNFTIDLNNYTVTQNGAVNDYMFLFKNDGEKDNTITLKNGTIDAGTENAGTDAYCAICTSTTSTKQITINTENINFVGNNSNGAVLKIRGGAELNVKAGTVITGEDSYLGIESSASTVNIYEGAEIYMNGTTSYNGCLVGVGSNGTINVYGGKGTGVSGGFIAMTSGGTINVYDGEWIANTDGTDANSNKSVLVAQSNKQNYAGAGNSIVNVSGGVFKGGYNCYGNAVGDAQINISGGIFSVNPSGYCAENYGAFPYDENSWVVRMVYGTQEFTLTAGWNWMSSYISEFDKSVGLSMLVNALGDNGIQIKNNLGAYTYGGSYHGWSGNLTATSVKEMYKVNVTADVTFEFEGGFVNYDELEIPLYPGWNYIGYPVDVTTNIADALIISGGANFMDVIKSQNGTSTYAGEDTGWLSSDFFTLIPGEGYMYQNTSGVIKTLKYSTKVTTTTSNNRNRNHWTVDATQYPSNMTMIATVDVEGGDYEVAAFVNGEVRGSARPIYVEELDAHILILTISGNDVEEMTFMYYDIATGEEVELSNRINYSNDAIVGSIAEPYILTRGTTGIGEASMSEISIYPNPTTTGTAINLQATCDRVEVYNALGVKVAEYQNVDSIDAIETAGIYVIRITNDGNVQNCRLVVK